MPVGTTNLPTDRTNEEPLKQIKHTEEEPRFLPEADSQSLPGPASMANTKALNHPSRPPLWFENIPYRNVILWPMRCGRRPTIHGKASLGLPCAHYAPRRRCAPAAFVCRRFEAKRGG